MGTNQDFYSEKRKIALELVKHFLENTYSDQKEIYLQEPDKFVELYNSFYQKIK